MNENSRFAQMSEKKGKGLTFTARSTSSWRSSSPSTASLSALSSRATCRRTKSASFSSSPLNRLRPWMANRASFPISFLLRHSGPRGRPSWNARTHAPAGGASGAGGGHSEGPGRGPWAEEEGEKGSDRFLGRRRRWRRRRAM